MRISLSLLAFFLCYTLFGQGTVRGTVLDKETGNPISFANVFISGTTLGTNSDVDGLFNIAKVPTGEQLLVASFLGYDTTSVKIVVKEGDVINEQLLLQVKAFNLQEVNISAEQDRARNEVKVSKLSISPQQIKLMPATAGEPDIAQYLQVLPGIISTGDAGGQIFIRGGSPVQNKIQLDGLTIINPFHSIGFFSTFETDAIRNVDVLTGAYNAEYAGRISAIVNINTREGNKKRLAGSVSASPFLGKIFIEGPIKKFTEEDGGSISFMLSQKYSYIDKVGPTLYPYVNSSFSSGFPYQINDTYGKISFNSKSGSNLNLFGFNYSDVFNSPEVANIGWNNYGGGANFGLILENSDLVMNGVIGYTNYEIDYQEEDNLPRYSSIGQFVGRIDFSYFLQNGSIDYGFEVNTNRTQFTFWNPFNLLFDESQNTTVAGAYIKFQKKFFDKLIIEPGFRAIYYSATNDPSYEPRLGIKFNLTDNIRLKAAGGIYSQNILSTSNERDVINLFTGFLTSPEGRINKLNTDERVEYNLQKSRQGVAGIEIDLIRNLSLNLEAYYKSFDQLIVVNRSKLSNSESNYVTEEGEAYGFDISAKYQLANFYLWSTYSHSYVNRNDGEQIYPTLFDRRHNINVVGNYQFGNDNSWSAGIRWNYGSGFPFTQTQAFFTYFPFENGATTDVITENPDDVGILYSDQRNGGRLPDYHRLDISLAKTITFTKYTNLEVTASATNLYNRQNIFFFDRVTYDRVDQLPLLPSLSLKFNF